MKNRIVSQAELIASLPPCLCGPHPKAVEEIKERYDSLVKIMKTTAERAKEPELILTEFYGDVHYDSQFIANFEVKDLAMPVQDQCNFHGQNTSQWLFAGAIVYTVRDHRISIHT